MAKATHSPPRHLGLDGKRWYRAARALYESVDPHEETMFVMAAEIVDRYEAARKQLDSEGVQVRDRFGQSKTNPLYAVLESERKAYVMICRELCLSEDKAPAPSRPNRIPGRYAR